MMADFQKGNFSGAGALLFLNEFCSDVSIIVESEGTKTRYPAHSVFLVAMSKVLHAMLTIDLQEKFTRQIIIKDSNPIAIKQFLRFLYDGGVDLVDWREALEVLQLAHKYDVNLLISRCEDKLISCISFRNVCLLHETAVMYSLLTLRTECRKLITDAGFVVLKTQSFVNMNCASVEYFLSHRCLNVENESFVLDSLRQWSVAECCRRCKEVTADNVLEIMQPLLRCIILQVVPEDRKSFLPQQQIEGSQANYRRVDFYVPSSLHKHMTSVRFVVELGSFASKVSTAEPLLLLKFSIDENAYLVGFRTVAMFRTNFDFGSTNPHLVLCREDSRHISMSFNLNSVPWRCGHVVGDHMWKETIAHFSQPAKIDINCTYCLILKNFNSLATKWPKTSAEYREINTVLGKINFFSFGNSVGVTELFFLPAPPDQGDVNQSLP